MSHPSWLPPKNAGEPTGHVTARMETTHAFGTPSISVSTQQTPKKFAPVVAPKPKYNPYRQAEGEGDFPPPPPPPLPSTDDPGNLPPSAGAVLPPPPPPDAAFFGVQSNPGGKTLEDRRSSLDAEIDSLTSILADLESSSPYKPRNQQGSGIPSGVSTPPMSTPVTGHKRMVIPNQPPLTATKKSASKPSSQPSPVPVTPVGTLKPQPVPASYTTASTPTRPTFNVQVKSAQPAPHFQPPGAQYSSLAPNQVPQPASSLGPASYAPSQVRPPDYSYVPQPPHHLEPSYTYAPPQARFQEPAYPGGPSYGGRNGTEPSSYAPQSSWKPEPAFPSPVAGNQNSVGQYPSPGAKKTYITEPEPMPQPKSGPSGPSPASNVPLVRPEDELEHLTKKMLYDMENPPSEEYFGRCARCGENVVGEGTGCTAMDQVFHVECFTCMTCNNKLRGQPFYAVEKKAYCEPCYINTLEQCSVCAKPIMERILRATGKAYHPHCFTCVICQRSLDGIPFTVDAGGNIHCIEDFHRKFAPRCSVCKEPIMPAQGQEETVRIVALDRDFHVQCYRCEDCGGLLSEGDNQGCYPLDGHILCKTCNSARIQALTAKASTDL
nr:lipoma-preferred partner [Pogona vitticeps]XP_020669273.1 lipoma-preferred partner [Pogona vitticeps]XP_020669274.1 lipoma-preferred partner [Pogona vitticeps]XP_020669275.1 lipoma-preferred partner [Pogona vitticeps]XP_020669276.1 lipoma-preferred partner [Pogona vitticeps]XP_020669277.1 lipoma-preferred partner [Pogona vitticeps]XP_020669278.1 lipoma-preferred partner [Pogona vitticeps]